VLTVLTAHSVNWVLTRCEQGLNRVLQGVNKAITVLTVQGVDRVLTEC